MVSGLSNEQPLVRTFAHFKTGDFFMLGLVELKRIKHKTLKSEASLSWRVRARLTKSRGWGAGNWSLCTCKDRNCLNSGSRDRTLMVFVSVTCTRAQMDVEAETRAGH